MENFQKELLKENITHGETLFPICLYTVNAISKEQILPYHWHDEFEFIYISKGHALFHIDDEVFELNEGQAVFINGGQLHSAFSDDGQLCIYHAIVFNHETLAGNFDICREYFQDIKTNKIKIKNVYRNITLWEDSILNNLREIINSLSNKNYGYHLTVKSRLLLIFSLLFSNKAYMVNKHTENFSVSSSVERLKKVIQYIQENYQRKIKIDELAHQINLSKHHFCRFFKQVTGKSPVDYINYYRISRAAALIENTNSSILVVGLESGFDNFSYFIKTFKKYKGCTPSEFKRLFL